MRTLSADESPWNWGVSCAAAATPTQAVTVNPFRLDTIFSPSRCSMANSFLPHHGPNAEWQTETPAGYVQIDEYHCHRLTHAQCKRVLLL